MSTRQRISDYVQQENGSHQVVVWSKTYCPYSRATKDLFRETFPNQEVVVHEIDVESDGYLIQQELQRLTGQRTVPNVFVNGQHLGGNDSTHQAYRSGQLEQLLLQGTQTDNVASADVEAK